MPILTRKEPHQCPLCPKTAVRSKIKEHLTFPGKKGPRCTALKKVIPVDVWENQILQFYTNDALLTAVLGHNEH